MGLDAVVLTVRIEEEFSISLSQEELTDLVRDSDITVGALYGLLLGLCGKEEDV